MEPHKLASLSERNMGPDVCAGEGSPGCRKDNKVSATQASAAGLAPKHGQPNAEHNILSSQLPVALLGEIKKDYKDYWITSLSEEGKGKHSDYFITLENADQIVQLRSSGSENWVITTASVKAE